MGGARPCRGCRRIRVFLCVALPLVAMIYLQPAVAVRLSRQLPDSASIGWAIFFGAVLVFALRLVLWRRQQDGLHHSG
jgi:hypothetical protein